MPAVFKFDRENPQVRDVYARFKDTLGVELQDGPRIVTITEPPRTEAQNDLMWALLGDIAKQVGFKPARWRGNVCLEDGGYVLLADFPDARRRTDEDFKAVLTAYLLKPKLFAGIDGGVVTEAMSTSRMSKKRMSELIDLIYAWGAEMGVVFSDPPPSTPRSKP